MDVVATRLMIGLCYFSIMIYLLLNFYSDIFPADYCMLFFMEFCIEFYYVWL